MNQWVENLKQLRIEKTIRNLEKNRMKAYHITNKEQLFNTLDELVQDGEKVCFGGSCTLEETGVLDYLKSRNIELKDRNVPGLTPEQVQSVMAEAFTADTYFASSNAVTEDGILYNVDGRGNRVAAMIYGPKSVILIVGYNKIVPTMQDAINRMEKIAAPANTMRLSCNTPCVKTGECMHCHSEERVCCAYVALAHQRIKDRIKVLILDDSYGF